MPFQTGNKLFLGKHHSKETIEKMRLSQKGKTMSDEAKEHMRQSALLRYKNKENHPMFGKKQSDESKKKMSLARLGVSPWNVGIKWGEEAKKKLSDFYRERFKNPTIHPRWKGGTKCKPDGRVLVWSKDHPFADSQGYVRRSHLVMEKILGRYLTRLEVVHHIDEDPTNDDPKNLQLFKSSREHASLHRRAK